MPSTTIRIDPEVYRLLLEQRAKWEIAKGTVLSFSATVRLLCLKGPLAPYSESEIA